MQSIIKKINNAENLIIGDKADVLKVKDAKEFLRKNGFAVFDDAYSSLVRHINGVRGDGVNIFGIMPGSEFMDIVMQNDIMNRFDKDDILIVGFNDMDYLIYDRKSNQYQTRDRYDDAVVEKFEKFSSALSYFLSL